MAGDTSLGRGQTDVVDVDSWENGSDHRLQDRCIVPVRTDDFSDCGRGGSELVSQTKILIRKDLKYEHRQS